MSAIKVTDQDFETQVLQSEKPVLVDYWAQWCGPCHALAPVLEQVHEEYADNLTIAKLNIDENPMAPTKYGIRGIPTLMLFKDGEILATRTGVAPKSEISKWLKSHLS